MNSERNILRLGASLGALAVVLTGSGAWASVTISTGATNNMSCTGGVCTATASNAVMNVGDLQTMLAAGNTTVATGTAAKDIDVRAALTWVSTSTLTLDADRSITVDKPISVMGHAGLVLTTNDGSTKGVLSFGPKGNVTFTDLGSSLTIDGAAYTLVNTVQSLAGAIANNPSGDFAFASSFDAKPDGTYTEAPVQTTLDGTFEGLGNRIANLTIEDNSKGKTSIGLFAELGSTGSIRDVDLANVDVTGHATFRGRPFKPVGSLVGDSFGTIFGASASGSVKALINNPKGEVLGGLAGYNEQGATVSHSHATTSVSNGYFSSGGLIGYNDGKIEFCYATGTVSGVGDTGGLVGDNSLNAIGEIIQSFATGPVAGGAPGGLVSQNRGSIAESYATGAVSGIADAFATGGLLSSNVNGTIAQSNSTSSVSGPEGAYIGGLIGYDNSGAGSLTNTDWDTDTSGIANLSQGAGNIANDPGITGLTTAQFQSGLPAGFDSKIWGEKANINGGLPYLLANPPR